MAAEDDLRQFLENTLQRFDSTIDLSPGSPAQTQVIDPIVSRLGEDPLTTDISKFIRDRMVQEFPQLAADNAGALEDLFSKPMQLLLEPFKREIQLTKTNQSVKNAELLADDEADALAANFFEEREDGSFASGPVRLFFNAPTTVRVTTDRRVATAAGLNYFPVENFFLNSGQMLFNRQGSFYFMDIIVRAEAAGDGYNVKAGEINFIDQTPGVVKVSNLSDFVSGAAREDNVSFLARIDESLTERSLVPPRGVLMRIPKVFNNVRALQVIGAGEQGMNRDILEGTGEGFLTVSGAGVLYGDWLFISQVVYQDDGPLDDIDIEAGDTVRLYLDSASLDPSHVIATVKVTHVYRAPVTVPSPPSSNFQYFLVLDRAVDLGATPPVAVRASVFKPGFITISKVPGGQLAKTLPDGQIHLGGHTDIFVRPIADEEVQGSLTNVTDAETLIARLDFTTYLNDNLLEAPPGINFGALGVKIGDSFVAETGDKVAGSYRILHIGDGAPGQDTVNQLRVDKIFKAGLTTVRGRIVQAITVDLVEPKIPKLPFNTSLVSDLQTTVGSNLFQFSIINVVNFGVKVGDTLRILSGPDEGDFTVVDFDPFGLIMDRAAGASGVSIPYEIFTKGTGLVRPLVRVKSLELLDATGQGTGITVPYGDAVDIRPTCDLEGAGQETKVFSKSAIIFPDTQGFWYDANGVQIFPDDLFAGGDPTPADARYSSLIESRDGIVRKIFSPLNPIKTFELNLPPFLGNGKRDKLLILADREDTEFTADPSGDNKTSPVAKLKVGDAFSLMEGPNQGKYIILDKRVLSSWSLSAHSHQDVVLLQVDPPLRSDPLRTAINLINQVNPPGPFQISATNIFEIIRWAPDWDNVFGFWYGAFAGKLLIALNIIGLGAFFPDIASVTTFMEALFRTSYSSGPSARGDFRLYFEEPVSLELFSEAPPTNFTSATDITKSFRLDPKIPPTQLIPEAEEPTLPTAWARDMFVPLQPFGGPYVALGNNESFVAKGVQTGDIFEYCPALNAHSARKNMTSSDVCLTEAGSNIVQVLLNPVGAINTQTKFLEGQLFFIESGPDIGAYNIVKVIQSDWVPPFPVYPASATTFPTIKLQLDKAMTHTTHQIPGLVGLKNIGAGGSGKRIYDVTPFVGVFVDSWVTLYAITPGALGGGFLNGEDAPFLGTFKIKVVGTETAAGPYFGMSFLELDRSVDFPTPFTGGSDGVFWIGLGDPPESTPPDTVDGGKQISDGVVRWRTYDPVPDTREITVDWAYLLSGYNNPLLGSDTTEQQLLFTSNIFLPLYNYQHKAPYRIIRRGLKRVSSTLMATRREGALYFVDVPVIGYGPGPEMNVTTAEAFLFSGRREVKGYVLRVDDEDFVFSDREQVKIILPNSVLPVGETQGLDNEVSLAGQTVQVLYNNAPLIEEIQRFVTSPLDRVTAANLLVRHFLPSYTFVDATYVGGSDAAVVAKDIIAYINGIPPEDNRLRVDKIVDLIKRRSATSISLPLTIITLTHGNDRRIRGMRSKDGIGGNDLPTFKGVFRQTYFIPGPDTSDQETRPDGEQTFLVRI